jgi:glycosyltransferase involved in cell wall biosynthesis
VRSADDPQAQLVLAGDADPEISRLLASRPDGRVRHEARRDDVSELLQAADLVVLPASWQEPFGRVVIEAM